MEGCSKCVRYGLLLLLFLALSQPSFSDDAQDWRDAAPEGWYGISGQDLTRLETLISEQEHLLNEQTILLKNLRSELRSTENELAKQKTSLIRLEGDIETLILQRNLAIAGGVVTSAALVLLMILF